MDELLNFIDGEGAAAAAKAKAKKKKAKKRGKGGAADEPGGDEAAGGQAAAQPAGAGCAAACCTRTCTLACELTSALVPRARSPARKASAASSASADALFPEDGFDDDEGTGSDLDAEQLARLDREVEEFELRLKAAATAAPKATGAQKQPEPERVAAVLSLLSGVLQTMGLGKTLQARHGAARARGRRDAVVDALPRLHAGCARQAGRRYGSHVGRRPHGVGARAGWHAQHARRVRVRAGPRAAAVTRACDAL